MRDPNYIADRNPFQLLKPPSWWLRGMAAFDPDLVMVPSRRKATFVLGRRRRLSRALAARADRRVGLDDPAHTTESVLCDVYGLVYVTTVIALGGWTQQQLDVLIDELRRRDTWAFGGPLTEAQQRAMAFAGGTRLAQHLDDQDTRHRARIDQQVRDDLYHATGDAWRSRQARKGERVLNAGRPSDRPRGLIATPRPMPTRRLIGV